MEATVRLPGRYQRSRTLRDRICLFMAIFAFGYLINLVSDLGSMKREIAFTSPLSYIANAGKSMRK